MTAPVLLESLPQLRHRSRILTRILQDGTNVVIGRDHAQHIETAGVHSG